MQETIRQLVICGNAWSDAGDMYKARDYCCRAFSLMRDFSDASLTKANFTISNSLFTIARIYRKNGEPDMALEYLGRSIDFEKALNRSNLVSMRYEEMIDAHGNKVLNQDVCGGLADLYAESDPELSAEYRKKSQEFDYLPGLEALASKVAIDSIDFPRREREQLIRNQKLGVSNSAELIKSIGHFLQ